MCNEAIILAGGMGKRLRNVVADKPKPMADINGRPFLEYLVRYLEKNNISRVIMSVGYKYEIIQTHFGEKFSGMQIDYAIEEYPLGTGGAIMLALKKTRSSNVFVLNGDTFLSIELQTLSQFHNKKNGDITVALKKMKDGSRYGHVIINEHKKIEAFREKKEGTRNVLINGGTYILNKHILFNADLPEKFSFEKDFLGKYYKCKNFFGLEFDDYFIDIGVPSSYERARQDFFKNWHCFSSKKNNL